MLLVVQPYREVPSFPAEAIAVGTVLPYYRVEAPPQLEADRKQPSLCFQQVQVTEQRKRKSGMLTTAQTAGISTPLKKGRLTFIKALIYKQSQHGDFLPMMLLNARY